MSRAPANATGAAGAAEAKGPRSNLVEIDKLELFLKVLDKEKDAHSDFAIHSGGALYRYHLITSLIPVLGVVCPHSQLSHYLSRIFKYLGSLVLFKQIAGLFSAQKDVC